MTEPISSTCPHCRGTGDVPKLGWRTTCTVCDGTGRARAPIAARLAAADSKAEQSARLAARDAARAEKMTEKSGAPKPSAPPKPRCEQCRGALYATNVSGTCTACQRKCKTCGGPKAANLRSVNCIDCAAKARSAVMTGQTRKDKIHV